VAIRLLLLPQNAILLPRFPPFVAFNGEKYQKQEEKTKKWDKDGMLSYFFLLTLQKQEKVLPIPQ